MADEVTNTNGAPTSGVPDNKGQGGSGKDEKVTITRAEFESMRRERDEARESERFWAKRAQSGGPATETVDEPEDQIETADLIPEVTGDQTVDEAIFNDPDKWADAISKGPQAISAFIRKAGYITATEAADIAAKVAQRTVQVERQKITTDNVILREFPDLSKQDSELFKATAMELKKLVAMDPRAKNSPSTLYAAASTAQAKLAAKRPARGGHESGDDDDRYNRFDEAEDDRRRRVDAQDGTRTRGRETDDDLDMLGPEAKEVIRQMGITPEEFTASAKETRGQRPRARR